MAGGSDTIASEIGKAWGRRTWSITSLAHVPPGTSGAMSLEGTAAGVAGALGLGAGAVALGLAPPGWLAAIVIGATAGSLLESWLGATLEAPGILNNDMLNFINTAAAAAASRSRVAAWTVMKKPALLLEFSRPFTLVAPALGFVSGAATAYGAAPREAWHADLIVYPADRR